MPWNKSYKPERPIVTPRFVSEDLDANRPRVTVTMAKDSYMGVPPSYYDNWSYGPGECNDADQERQR